MKVIIESTDLLRSMKHVRSVVEKRNTISILANALLDASSAGFVIKGTDLDIEASVTTKAQVDVEGTLTVNADTLYTFVSKLPKGSQVKLERDPEKDTLRISCGRSRCSLPTLPADDFPSFNVGDLTHHFTIPTADLVRLFGKAQFAISTEETRYYLNGVYLHQAASEKGIPKLCAVATDGHRLAKIESNLPASADGMPGIIVPRKTVGQVLNLCQGNESVEIGVSASKIVFTFSDVVLASKLIDGTFPDFQKVIPVGQNKVAFGWKVDLADAANRVSTVSSERGRAVKLSFLNSSLVLSVVNPDSGSATEELELEYDADPIDIGFNARYLSDMLKEIDQEDVQIGLSDPSSPALFCGKGDASATFVLMPMRI